MTNLEILLSFSLQKLVSWNLEKRIWNFERRKGERVYI